MDEIAVRDDQPAAAEPQARPALRREELAGQDLSRRDLRRVDGLRPSDLAGADLTDARLPDGLSFDEPLRQVEEISRNARKVFIGLLLGCVYAALTIGTTTDVALIVNTASSPLPIINTPVPIAGFYIVGALVLTAVYAYFHFYLQRLWRTLASLPAVFSDGTALDDKAYPWLLTGLARQHMPHLRDQPRPLARFEILVAVVLAWWLVPITLTAMWLRYLPSHHGVGITALVFLISLAAGLGLLTHRLAVETLGRAAPNGAAVSRITVFGGRRPDHRVLTSTASAAALGALLVTVSGSVYLDPTSAHWRSAASDREERFVGDDWRWLHWLLDRAAGGTYAHLREADVSTKLDGWQEGSTDRVQPADLRGRHLAFADAAFAFLAKSDLRHADLHQAGLSLANLQEANLSGANLQEADLSGANLQEADLRSANLREADLRSANLREAVLGSANLREADLYRANLQGADLRHANLREADLSGANLQEVVLEDANLRGADLFLADLQEANLTNADLQAAKLTNADLQAAKLWNADLQEAYLFRANLQEADLERANLQEADLTSANLQEADLKRANLQEAHLEGANLQEADLQGANLQKAPHSA